MLLVTAASIPIFFFLLYAKVDSRVQDDLMDEMADFHQAYEQWEEAPNQSTKDFKQFIDAYLIKQLPEDDNFLIVFLNNKLYKSNPTALPDQLKPGSSLAKRWLNLTKPITGTQDTKDPSIGTILYLVQPLKLEGEIRGAYVAVHKTAGERQEALAGVFIFIQVAAGVVLISFFLAWITTGQLLIPVQKLAATARSVSESNLTQRIPIEGSGELADLANTFNDMMDRIQNAFIGQRNFLNEAGHELRTPITIIRGHLEVLDDDPQEWKETQELVLDELDRMGRFINDMILLAKSERPDFLQLETIDVGLLTEELFAKAQPLAERNWQLKIEGTGQMIGDRQRLTGAILNLAQNATQHTQPSDLIELGSSIHKNQVYFWVRDTGEGIALGDQGRIFERFARAANSYRRSEGAGLGLAIVRAIVEAHGGRVELVSQLGFGSTFILILPLEPPEEKLAT
jgi:signal transduction histidine kinase